MNITDDRMARAALTRIFEPGDRVALALVGKHGAVWALHIVLGALPVVPFWDVTYDELKAAVARGAGRHTDLDPQKDLDEIAALGGGFLIPGDEHWPAGLDDLEVPPLGLWYRGNLSAGIPTADKCAALTGSRDCTSYGAAVTGDLAYGLAQRGITVVSGLAYGIEAHAHRSALAGSTDEAMPTIAVVSGGVDRFYPNGNADLGRSIIASGLMVSEMPTGTAPTRFRFLQRNRIIAALSGVVCVVEARYRSGALNTAHHAETIARHVAAVPGSVHSANSAGCHRLLKEGAAVLVTDAAELAELLAS